MPISPKPQALNRVKLTGAAPRILREQGSATSLLLLLLPPP